MFQKTLRKLTTINSLAFLIIFIIFEGIVFGYVSYRLFDKIDESMRYRAGSVRITNGRMTFAAKSRTVYDPRTFILLRSVDGRVINLYPFQTEELEAVMQMTSEIKTNGLQSLEYENHAYRIFSLPYLYKDNIINTDKGVFTIREVIAVSIVDSEVALLNNLIIIFVVGLVVGTTIIFLAGYYLARRALVPIRISWEKQQRFVADASHELRSPLTVITSNAELMLRHPNHTVEEESKRVTNILREAMRMKRLVSTLLTLARADADQIELQLSTVILNKIVEVVCEQFAPLAELKGIEFRIDMQEQLKLKADRERLHQLFVILLDNAIKYTAAPGQVTLLCYQKNNNINISIKDTGCGIAAEDLPYVFDRFFRGDKSRSRETGGTGLGLAIAKWIVEKHNGKITVQSQMDVGTDVYIMLPIDKY